MANHRRISIITGIIFLGLLFLLLFPLFSQKGCPEGTGYSNPLFSQKGCPEGTGYSNPFFHKRGVPKGRGILTPFLIKGVATKLTGYLIKSRRRVEEFFPGTNQEVKVYSIFGKRKGPTLLVFGGIQGDEPGGYLAADRYVSLNLKKGNLIVVPRLNLAAILAQKREGLTGDMNRKFALPKNIQQDPDIKVVNLARDLIANADYILNLHQGSGFYSPIWINHQRNPLRWGQCNVIDAFVFDLPNGERLELESFAQNVVRRINSKIQDENYHFLVNNTNTGDKKSLHKEQRKSLTYYALTQKHKIALGIEVTKKCSSPQAVAYLSIVINSVLKELGIAPEEFPGEDPDSIAEELKKNEKFSGLKVKINGCEKLIIPGQNIFLKIGEPLQILNLETEKSRGWYVNLVNSGSYNALGQTYWFTKDNKLLIHKDGKLIASFEIMPRSYLLGSLEVNLDGRVCRFHNQETILLPKNGRLRILKVYPEKDKNKVKVNLKGFIGNKGYNDGEDSGYVISADDLIPKYALDYPENTFYRIEISEQGNLVGEVFLKLT